MEVTTTVEFPEWSEDSVEAAIIETVAKKIIKQAKDEIVSQAAKMVKSEISQQIGDIVREVVDAPVRETNYYGEPKGEPVTMRELVMKEARTWWEVKVSSKNGKPTTYRSDNPVSRGEYLTGVAVAREIEAAYKAEIAKAVQKVRETLDGKVTEMVRDAVKQILNV